MFDVAKAISKLGDAVNSGFSYAKRCKEVQSETELIKDRKKMQKAIDAAERIILISHKYYKGFLSMDQEEYVKQLERFMRNN